MIVLQRPRRNRKCSFSSHRHLKHLMHEHMNYFAVDASGPHIRLFLIDFQLCSELLVENWNECFLNLASVFICINEFVAAFIPKIVVIRKKPVAEMVTCKICEIRVIFQGYSYAVWRTRNAQAALIINYSFTSTVIRQQECHNHFRQEDALIVHVKMSSANPKYFRDVKILKIFCLSSEREVAGMQPS